jgi:hypothetical protein
LMDKLNEVRTNLIEILALSMVRIVGGVNPLLQ